jgi:CDP-diglyceride synthetase
VLPPSPATVKVPETLPAVLGVTATDRFPDCPTASAIGSVVPERANCALENVACVMFTETVPVFVTETFCIVFLPTETVPKLTLVGFSWNSAATACCACLTMPAHPLSSVSAGINSNKAGRTLVMRYCIWTGFIFFPTVSATAAHGLSPVP